MNAKLTRFVVLLGNLSDADVLELHRIVSRRATLIRQRDPVYVQNQRRGYFAAQSKMSAARASETSR